MTEVEQLRYENDELKKSLKETNERNTRLYNRVNFLIDNMNNACGKCLKENTKSSKQTGLRLK